MKNRWSYNLGILCIIIGCIIAVVQAVTGFYHGFQEGLTGEVIEMNGWFREESPMHFFILGAILIGFYKVLNVQKSNSG